MRGLYEKGDTSKLILTIAWASLRISPFRQSISILRKYIFKIAHSNLAIRNGMDNLFLKLKRKESQGNT